MSPNSQTSSCNLDENLEIKKPPKGSRAPAPAHTGEPFPKRQEDEGQRTPPAGAGATVQGLGSRGRASVPPLHVCGEVQLWPCQG